MRAVSLALSLIAAASSLHTLVGRQLKVFYLDRRVALFF